MTQHIVAKVGGSLYDLPDLRERLQAWLRRQQPASVLLVPGGGTAAELIRAFDQAHRLGEEAAHWLALRCLTLNAWFLAELLGLTVTPAWDCAATAILDPFAFAKADEAKPGHLSHSWEATSDSAALRAAQVYQASRLTLLKSVDLPPGISWRDAAERGIVDRFFPKAVACANRLTVNIVNLRRSEH